MSLVLARRKSLANCSGVKPAGFSASAARTGLGLFGKRLGPWAASTLMAGDPSFSSSNRQRATESRPILGAPPGIPDIPGRSQRMTTAAFSFLCSLPVQFHQSPEDLIVSKVVPPAVGVGYRRVQTVVDLLENGHKPLFMDGLLLFGQPLVGTEFRKNIIHVRHSESCEEGLLSLPVSVEGLAKGGDSRSECVRTIGGMGTSRSCGFFT